jgi:hypothetical protein
LTKNGFLSRCYKLFGCRRKQIQWGYDPKSRRLKPHNRNSYGWLGKISIYSNRSPKPGEYSKPEQFTDKMGDVGYRFNYLKTRIPPHKANLDEDFTKIKEAARQDKINRNLSKWFDDKSKTTFINISDEFGSCDELKNGKNNKCTHLSYKKRA